MMTMTHQKPPGVSRKGRSFTFMPKMPVMSVAGSSTVVTTPATTTGPETATTSPVRLTVPPPSCP